MKVSNIRWAGIAALAAMGMSACGASTTPNSSSAPGGVGGEAAALNLVAFAVPKAANNAIQALWAQTPDGAGVTWVQSYGASGDQSRAVESGLFGELELSFDRSIRFEC